MHQPLSRVRVVSAALLLVFAVAAMAPFAAPARAESRVPPYLITGHGGVGAAYVNGQWDVKAVDGHDDPPVDIPANEALFHLAQDTTVAANAIPSQYHGWLGTSPGQTMFIVPQNASAAHPVAAYFGFNVHGMTDDDKAALAPWTPADSRLAALHHHDDEDEGGAEDDEEAEAWIQLDLLGVRGLDGGAAPGEFSLWTADDDGDLTVWMSTAQTPSEGNRFFLDVQHGHSHVNWGFTTPGVYEIELQATTYLASDPTTPIVSPPTKFYFGVLSPVPEPSSAILLGTLLTAGLAFARRRAGRP